MFCDTLFALRLMLVDFAGSTPIQTMRYRWVWHSISGIFFAAKQYALKEYPIAIFWDFFMPYCASSFLEASLS